MPFFEISSRYGVHDYEPSNRNWKAASRRGRLALLPDAAPLSLLSALGSWRIPGRLYQVYGLIYDIHIDDDGLVRQLVTADNVSE
jgi:hypothetical protein